MAQSQCDVAKEPRRWGTGRGGEWYRILSRILSGILWRPPIVTFEIPAEFVENSTGGGGGGGGRGGDRAWKLGLIVSFKRKEKSWKSLINWAWKCVT